MIYAYHAATILSVALFLFYGLSVLFSDAMVAEFERFGLSRFRKLTGGLEVLGALGLAAGYLLSPLTILASGGLALLMALGVASRIRVRDSLAETLPAFVLMLVNIYILNHALARVL